MIFINDYHNRIVKLSNFNESYEVIAPFTRLIETITKNFLGKASKNLVRKNYSKNTRD